MSDRMTAWLRTVVPGAWAALIVWTASQADWLPVSVTEWLSSEATVGVVIGLVIGVWHWVWTKIGPHVPDWLETIVMGHTGTAVYGLSVAIPYTEEHFTDE